MLKLKSITFEIQKLIKLKIRNFIGFFIATGILLSCSSEGCYEDTEADLIINLLETDAETISEIDSITIFGIGPEDSLLYKDASLKTVNLPLYAAEDYTDFAVINGLISDTIRVWYSSSLTFISKGCGYIYLHSIESIEYTTHRIDTVLIINKSVNTEDEENLRTFF